MVKITIENLAQKEVESKPGNSVLQIVQANFIDWMHACGGKGRCTTCKFIVVQGKNNFGPLSRFEENYQKQGELGSHERLACQAVPVGDCIIRVPEEGKLPHMKYSN